VIHDSYFQILLCKYYVNQILGSIITAIFGYLLKKKEKSATKKQQNHLNKIQNSYETQKENNNLSKK
jgi:hypothetical protein